MRSVKVSLMDGKKQKLDPPKTIFQLKVTLLGIEPLIWRRFLVPGGIMLHKFHKILQIVMGWEDYHLYGFTIGDFEYGIPDPESPYDFKDSRKTKLQKAVSEKMKFAYVYDFGDNWQHEIQVEQILKADKGLFHPVCLGGKRACPPEDVGSTDGYEDFLEAYFDPTHEEHGQMHAWAGDDFDPERFDLQTVNEKLGKFR
jgi:hypothetical protein